MVEGIKVSLEATRVEALCQMSDWDGVSEAVQVSLIG